MTKISWTPRLHHFVSEKWTPGEIRVYRRGELSNLAKCQTPLSSSLCDLIIPHPLPFPEWFLPVVIERLYMLNCVISRVHQGRFLISWELYSIMTCFSVNLIGCLPGHLHFSFPHSIIWYLSYTHVFFLWFTLYPSHWWASYLMCFRFFPSLRSLYCIWVCHHEMALNAYILPSQTFTDSILDLKSTIIQMHPIVIAWELFFVVWSLYPEAHGPFTLVCVLWHHHRNSISQKCDIIIMKWLHVSLADIVHLEQFLTNTTLIYYFHGNIPHFIHKCC